MTEEELCNMFEALVNNNELRFERAKRDQERLQQQYESGQEPTGYRADFLRNATLAMAATLGDKCREFDQKYKGDKATVQDCLNAAFSLVNLILRQGGKQIETTDDGIKIVPLE